jgi:hypothetical protein
MFHWVFFIKNAVNHQRMALHFLKLPDAASPGVIALAQELKSTITHKEINKRVIIGKYFL